MFDANGVLIDAFVDFARGAYRDMYPGVDGDLEAGLERATRTALTILRDCDCPYHDLEHTLLVTEAGIEIFRGRALTRGDLSAASCLQAVVALLFHDIGYRRGLLRDDRAGSYVVDPSGKRVTPPKGATDVFLMPYHVARGCMFVMERFAGDPVIDGAVVASYIEMTRFPIPKESLYQQLDSIGALVRAADLIGQMGDPGYARKHTRLFAELEENGEAERLGYGSPTALRDDFPAFFYAQVLPFIPAALGYLRTTHSGQQWIANLVHHLHGQDIATAGADYHPVLADTSSDAAPLLPGKPHIAVSNT